MSYVSNHHSVVIQGSKLIWLSGKSRDSRTKSLRFFFCGVVLAVASIFTLYASIIYNNAIATTNTDLIANAVIILFITDLDEMVLSILASTNPCWFTKDEPIKEVDERLKQAEQKMSQVKEILAQSNQERLETERGFADQLAEVNERLERMKSHIVASSNPRVI